MAVRPIRRLVVITERGIEADPGVEQRLARTLELRDKILWLLAAYKLSPSISTNRKGKGRDDSICRATRIEAADRSRCRRSRRT